MIFCVIISYPCPNITVVFLQHTLGVLGVAVNSHPTPSGKYNFASITFIQGWIGC